jgi:hypothetical protein
LWFPFLQFVVESTRPPETFRRTLAYGGQRCNEPSPPRRLVSQPRLSSPTVDRFPDDDGTDRGNWRRVAAVFGAVFGVPLGIVIGRELWILFARSIDAVPDPSIPLTSILLVGVGTVVFANIVAALPGRSAARTSTAVVLRTA